MKPELGLVITTLTETHITSEHWFLTEEEAKHLRAVLGEPTLRQMVPLEVVNQVLDDGNHIVLD